MRRYEKFSAPAVIFPQRVRLLGKSLTMTAEQQTEIFNQWVRAEGQLINKLCYFHARTDADFDDLRQEVLLALWRSAARFRGECAERTWIYRVALNACVSYVRRERWDSRTESIDLHPGLITADAEHAAMVSEMRELIEGLPPLDRAIILMWLDGLDYAEISQVAGLSPSAVGTRISRIKKTLAKESNK